MHQPEHVVPFTVKDGMIIVEGDVHGCPCRFLVDTGCGALVLDPAVVARTGAGIRGTATLHGFAAVELPRLDGVTVVLGTLSVTCAAGAVLPLADIQQARGPQVDGIIGYDLFARHAVEFDFPSSLLRFFSSDSAHMRSSEAVLPLSIDARVPVISAYLVTERGDTVLARLMLDSGTVGSFDAVLSSVFALANPQLLNGAWDSPGTATGLGGNSMATVEMPVREMRLHTLRLRNPTVALVGTEHMGFKHGICDGTMGFAPFSGMTITLNYPGRTVTVRKPSAGR